MAQNEQRRRRHLRVDGFHQADHYKSKKRGGAKKVPQQSNPAGHGRSIQQQITGVVTSYSVLAQSWAGNEDIKARGICVELVSAPNAEIQPDRLLDNGWELLNERQTGKKPNIVKFQTWFVPDGRLGILASIVGDYLTRTRKGQPLYRPLIDAIEKVAIAAASQLWTETEPFPADDTLWFEIWLRRGASETERQAIITQFKLFADQNGIRVGEGQIILPEHTIVAAYGKGSDLARDFKLLNCIAEIRRGRDYADVFSFMRPGEQFEYAAELLDRVAPADENAPWVCVLDTGINRGHPLLERFIGENNNLTIKQDWTPADDDNHGTLMAGLCLYGDLAQILSGTESINLPVNVEGVKIVPPPQQRKSDEKLAGYFTAQGVSLAEGAAKDRKRTWCITTTMSEPNPATPSSWSAQMDRLACGLDNDDEVHRLLCLSAGNIPQDLWAQYPQSNYAHSIRNPGQSWNALCVGAYTELQTVRNETAYKAIAARGALAPVSSTSLDWEQRWPNKPDVVFEGGNAGCQKANNSTLALDELMLLSTHAQFNEGVFGVTSGTSPATALAARMAGHIMAEYPNLWPETVRGLIVHSAEWTDTMKATVPKKFSKTKPKRANFLLRTVGYGVPSLRRAIECRESSATMIAECRIQPFKIDDEGEVHFNELHLHSLPWPQGTLAKYHNENVRMRVTLSYFIEPNPGNRGYTSQFRYANCALRFKVSSPGQQAKDLLVDVSKIAAEELAQEEGTHVAGSTEEWTIGQACFRGSVHSDIWEGSAADLMSMQHIAVFPVTGWWRTRSSHDRAEAQVNYSLIVSIESDNPELEIYSEIETVIENTVMV